MAPLLAIPEPGTSAISPGCIVQHPREQILVGPGLRVAVSSGIQPGKFCLWVVPKFTLGSSLSWMPFCPSMLPLSISPSHVLQLSSTLRRESYQSELRFCLLWRLRTEKWSLFCPPGLALSLLPQNKEGLCCCYLLLHVVGGPGGLMSARRAIPWPSPLLQPVSFMHQLIPSPSFWRGQGAKYSFYRSAGAATLELLGRLSAPRSRQELLAAEPGLGTG